MFWTKTNLDIAVGYAKQSKSRSEFMTYFSDTSFDAIRRAFHRNGLQHPDRYFKKINITECPPVDKVPGSFKEYEFTKELVNSIKRDFYKSHDLSNAIRPVDGYVKPFELWNKWSNFDFATPMFPEIKHPEPETKITKIIVCPDVHVPYHDKKAWKLFLKALATVKPDILVLVGDFADIKSLMAHAKKPKDERFFKKEIAAVLEALNEISAIGIKRVIYCEGNHENRISRYIASNAPELDEMLDAKSLFKIEERGWEWVPYGDYIRIGELSFIHDVGRVGVNAARQSLADFGDNICFGHTHRAAVVYSGTVEGRQHVALNVGWLGDYDAIDYRNRHTAKREWTHGCGLVYQTPNGNSYCNFVPFINGECVIDGKFVKV